MSTNLAETMPLGLPDYAEATREEHPRHIEIVSTRTQRRARPRPIYAIIIVGGLFALFIAQLLMSIVVSNGAYQISGLQAEQRTLTQTENALSEKADLLASPQNVANLAAGLGMGETDQTPNFLDLGTGKIIGKQKASNDVSSIGTNVVPNKPLSDARRAARQAAKDAKAGSATKTDSPADSTTSGTLSE